MIVLRVLNLSFLKIVCPSGLTEIKIVFAFLKKKIEIVLVHKFKSLTLNTLARTNQGQQV